MNGRFAYDDVPYDTEANADTHPSSMGTLARLHGLPSAPPERARVLEIGCGNGENLLAAATYLPRARFVGFDLAGAAIAAGRRAAEAARAHNVTLFAADIKDVRANGVPDHAPGSFDYVIAHGMYSWVPEPVRADLLGVMREALAPEGLGFVSINALPAWELRRALRELARDATRDIDDPAAKVAATLKLVDDLGRQGKDASGFFGALSAAAREYAEHVARATSPDAPFSRYVFHDLLADCNDAFTLEDLAERLARAGLRHVCETPLARPRSAGEPAASPFLQVLVQRDDAPAPRAPSARGVEDLVLWADLTPAASGAYRTSTGALVRPIGADGLGRAARHAPGFVPVRDLVDDGDALALQSLSEQLFDGLLDGVFTLCAAAPGSALRADPGAAPARGADHPHVADRPRAADHPRARARAAVAAHAPSAVVTNALHRSFRVPWAELAILQLLDGQRATAEVVALATTAAVAVPRALAGPLAGDARDAASFVDAALDRFARHLFLVERAREERP